MSMFPTIQCNDGFSVSVQASEFHYCMPRNDKGLGFPSEREELIIKWAENDDIPKETVYGWVPVSVLLELIEKRGGTDDTGREVLEAITKGGSLVGLVRECLTD